MSDMGDIFRALRVEQQDRRAARLPLRTQEILDLQAQGFVVRQLTPFHFRVNESLDLYPTHRRYHAIATNRRGTYRTALDLARRVCGGARA